MSKREATHHDPVRVAVTGVGGGGGQAIMKALMLSTIPIKIYPVDITPFSAGLYTVKMQGKVLPKPEEDIEAWHTYFVENKIECVIPGSDHDIEPLAAVREAWAKDGIAVAVQPLEFCRTSNSKYLTTTLLKASGLDYPRTFVGDAEVVSSINNFIYPLVVKPDYGMTSRGVQIVNDWEELRFYYNRTTGPIVQEYLEGEEYTCSLFFGFRDRGLNARFVMKRDLYMGSTYRAEPVDQTIFDEFFSDFTKKIGYPQKLFGPINLQLKDVPGRGPVIFEINARCSGSTAIRAHFGYNDPHMILREFVLGEQAFQPHTTEGVAFRFWEELFMDGVSNDDLVQQEKKLKGKNHAWLG